MLPVTVALYSHYYKLLVPCRKRQMFTINSYRHIRMYMSEIRSNVVRIRSYANKYKWFLGNLMLTNINEFSEIKFCGRVVISTRINWGMFIGYWDQLIHYLLECFILICSFRNYYAPEGFGSVNGRSMNRYYGTSKSSTIWLPNRK